jgi:hypothetical protein
MQEVDSIVMRNTKVDESSRGGGALKYNDWVERNISSGTERFNG